MNTQALSFLYLSQEELIEAGAFDLKLAIQALQDSVLAFQAGRILFPDKIVQIFDEKTQERINCLPATLLDKHICGVKWVSVFPNNPRLFQQQNLSALIVLSNIVNGFPVCVMDGTLCSNMRVAAMSATAADLLARQDASSVGFIGAGEQAKMHLLGLLAVRPELKTCKVAARYAEEEESFIDSLRPLAPQLDFVACQTDLEQAVRGCDLIVTATSAQAPLLQADWIKPGAFYSHVGGWEDDYRVVQLADKLVCDDWEAVKHRSQTISRCYQEGLIGDDDIYANIGDILNGSKPGREREDEFIYFNAVGLAYTDIAIATALYERARDQNKGRNLFLQEQMIFDHPNLADKVRF